MSIIRVVHNKENPFVQINKKALWDERLSLKAVGLWARCLSRKDDWRFNIKELAKKSKEGRRAIDSAIHELIKFGYAVRLEHWEKLENGKFKNGGVEYVFFEFEATQEDKDQVLEEFKKSFRHCCFSNRRNGNSRNSKLLNKEEEKEKEEEERKREEGCATLPPPTSLPTPVSQEIKIPQENYERLVEDFDKSLVDETIESLKDYGANEPKKFAKYKNHTRTVEKWIESKIDANPVRHKLPHFERNKAYALDGKNRFLPDGVDLRINDIYCAVESEKIKGTVLFKLGSTKFKKELSDLIRKAKK